MKSIRILILSVVSILVGSVLFTNCASTKSADPISGPSNNNNSNNTPPPAVSCFSQFGPANSEWSGETEVPIDGFVGNANEPKTSGDQVVLFWNDKPASCDTAMNIHYAVKQSNGRFLYIGTLPGTVDPNQLDGVPAIDANNNFYFVSTRSYFSNFQMIYGSTIQVLGVNSLGVSNVSAADNLVSLKKIGTVDMDIDISWDGSKMIVSRAEFAGKAYPEKSKLVMMNSSSSTRTASSDSTSDSTLANVNVPECRIYAGNLSNDMKELFYTALQFSGDGTPETKILVAKRSSTSEPFGKGSVISAIQGFTEAPSISINDGGKTLYYHKLDPTSGVFKIYKVSRP